MERVDEPSLAEPVTGQRRLLVTGGTGVIGAWVVRGLVEDGHRVAATSRNASGPGSPILSGMEDDFEWMPCDIMEPLALTRVIVDARPDAIIHLASAKPWQMDVGFVENPTPQLGIRAIFDATANLLELCRCLGVGRVVFAGSKASYAPFEGRHSAPEYEPVPETYPSVPYDIYGITKLAAEQVGKYYHDHLGVEFASLRFGSTYGPFKRGAAKYPAGMISSAVEGQSVEVELDASTYAERIDDFIYNRDVARAVVCALRAPAFHQHVYNVGTGVGVTTQDIVETLNRIPGVAAPRVTLVDKVDETDRPVPSHADAFAGILDTKAAARDLAYTSAFDLESGIADMASFLAEHQAGARVVGA